MKKSPKDPFFLMYPCC